MRFPWSRRAVEVRQSQPFTDAVLSAISAGVSGSGARASATAALEAAAGAVARGFAAARVDDAPPAVEDALTPGTLALIGRDLIRRGESVHLIELARGDLRLYPAGSWDVRGSWDPESWMVRCDLFGPSGNVTRFVPHAQCVHVRYAVDAARPWHGIGPLGWAALSGQLHAGTVAALDADMRAVSAYAVPMPGLPRTPQTRQTMRSPGSRGPSSRRRAKACSSKRLRVLSAETPATSRRRTGCRNV